MLKSLFGVAIAVLALGAAMAPQQPMANSQKESVQPTCIVTVPSNWGEFKGASNDFGLAFQDSAGTLRFIRNSGCEIAGFQRFPAAFLEVRRK
jgi:hypothetical protein